MQGEPILCLSSFLMFLGGWKEFSRAKEQGAFFGIAGKILGIAGRRAAWNCEWWQGWRAGAGGLNAGPRFAEATPASEFAIRSSPPWKSVGNPRASCLGDRGLLAAGRHRPPPLWCREREVEIFHAVMSSRLGWLPLRTAWYIFKKARAQSRSVAGHLTTAVRLPAPDSHAHGGGAVAS